MNIVVISGNLTRAPEFRNGQFGEFGEVGVAIDDRERRGDRWESKTIFVDVTVSGKNCEMLKGHYVKGDTVHVTGKLDMDNWKDKETGKDRSKLKIKAISFSPCRCKLQQMGGQNQHQPQQQPQQYQPQQQQQYQQQQQQQQQPMSPKQGPYPNNPPPDDRVYGAF